MMRKYKLSDVAVVNPKDKLEDLAIRVSFVPMQNVSENGDIDVSQTRLALEVSKGFTSFVDGDVLMAKITPCMENGKGAVATGLCNGRGFGSTEFFVIRPDHTKVRSEWIYYYTTQKQFRLDCEHNMTGSAGQKRVPKAYLENKKIEIPALAEQDDVLAKLGHIKRILTLRQQQLQKLDELVKARFVEMFGDMYLNSKGWPEAKLESMADVVSGITKGRKTKAEDLTEVPYMAVSNVKDGYIDWTTMKTIEATQQEIEKYRLLADDVLMTEGGDPDKVGRGAIIKEPLENCIHQNHIFRVRLDESMMRPEFFAEYLQHQRSKRYFLRCAKQTTGIASINMTQLRALPVLMPPLSRQEEFVLFKAQVNKSKVAVQRALDETQLLFDSLMQKYFG